MSISTVLSGKVPAPLRLFLKQSFMLWVGQVGGILISVLVSVFIARELGPSGRGIYTWLLTLAGVGTNLALFGLDAANRRLAAKTPQHIPALIRLNVLLVATGGIAIALVLTLMAWNQPAAGSNGAWVALAMLTVPLNAFCRSLHPVLVAQHRITAAMLFTLLPRVALAVAFAGLLVMGWVTQGTALAANLLMSVISLALAVWLLKELFRHPPHMHIVHYLLSLWGTYAGVYIAAISFFLMQKVDVLLIGYLMDNASTGYYGVASNLVDLMLTPITIMAGLLATRFAAGHVGKLSWQVLVFTMGCTLAGCTFVYLIAPWLVPFLFGQAFAPGVEVLQLLCPAVVALALFMLMQNALTSLGRARYIVIPPLAGCVTNVVLNFILIPPYGLAGACWATIAAYALAALLAVVLVRGKWHELSRPQPPA